MKRKNRSKRSMGSLPKGLPHKKAADLNPFEFSSTRQKRPKYEVHNRQTRKSQSNLSKTSNSAKELSRRRQLLRQSLHDSSKSNVFVDRRLGEYNSEMTAADQNLARLVRERSRRSKKMAKFSLQNADEPLTHRGKEIDENTMEKEMLFSDDEDSTGQLDALDTALHFGGPGTKSTSAYGPSGTNQSMTHVYSERKSELDDLIKRRKVMKLERMKARDQQVEAVATMDETFKELASMLQFRDKEKEVRQQIAKKRAGTLPAEDREMDDWNKEMREFMFSEKKARATDRTKTPEEIVREEADLLHMLETRRLARMNGDFEDDDFSDLSDGEGKRRTRKKGKRKEMHPEMLDNSDSEDEETPELTAKFTADGLVYVDKFGAVVRKMGSDGRDEGTNTISSGTEHATDRLHEHDHPRDTYVPLKVGTRVQGNYHANEQVAEGDHWYEGVIRDVHRNDDRTFSYDVDYDDGDFEERMDAEHVRPIQTKDVQDKKKPTEEEAIKSKRDKAMKKARSEIPYVFEVPTTSEALTAVIGDYATTGEDVSLIIHRIHASNSIKLDRRNAEKMQNFYDVLLRRFLAIGDAIYFSGNGGQIGRYQQLDTLTKTLYHMSQDSSESAGAVWKRRLGILHNAHAKRIRDAQLERPEGEVSAWPSLGTVLLLRALGHIFPTTDKRHPVMTPATIFLSQVVAHTPVVSIQDVALGVMCSGLLIEYTKGAKRISPEALAFLSGVIALFVDDSIQSENQHALFSLETSSRKTELSSWRGAVSAFTGQTAPKLCLEKSNLETDVAKTAILCSALHMAGDAATSLAGSLNNAEREVFAEIAHNICSLKPSMKKNKMPPMMRAMIGNVAAAVANTHFTDETQNRIPLARRSDQKRKVAPIKSLAPLVEDSQRWSTSKDKGKNSLQVATDRVRREFKREQKAVARELRLDAAFIENERRSSRQVKDTRAREARHRNFAWLESEQAAMNQQVRLGGGLIKGGGMGAAKAKAKSGKMGIKKGGKL